MTLVHCGIGNQPIKWLADVAIHKFDSKYNMEAGAPVGLRFENGTEVNFNGPSIQEDLTDDVHLWIIFKDDLLE